MMEYGCIGEHLSHSFSAEIHRSIGAYSYELQEVKPQDLQTFVCKYPYFGINVTIPYKQAVMPYLDEISEEARAIGAVNTIVRRDGKLCGTNTDFSGMRDLILRAGISLAGKCVRILGTGGTAHTAKAVAASLGARDVACVSRTGKEGAMRYETLRARRGEAEILINATPCGMFPGGGDAPVDLADFPALSGVIDVIYNPLRTALVLQARKRGIPAVGGLYMLVRQAVLAAEFFTGAPRPAEETERIFRALFAEKENIVLIGMPGCGKTTVGRALAAKTGRRFFDTDEEIVRQSGKSIPDLFASVGEAGFREIERGVIRSLSAQSGVILATGGGAVLREENVSALRQNGRLYLLERPFDPVVCGGRPLVKDAAAWQTLADSRRPFYDEAKDEVIDNTGAPETAATHILAAHGGENRPLRSLL